MFPAYFRRMAAYNAWANKLLYAATSEIPVADYHRETGAFFGSLHGTLNHILVGDQIWLRRLTGEGETYSDLDHVPFESLEELSAARASVDQRIIDWVRDLTVAEFDADMGYTNMAGDPFTDRLDLLLCHFFNHQTHHRGQAHGLISALGHTPPSLDLIYFSRI
jgi:uncharacterized damage-inducible protein DinB